MLHTAVVFVLITVLIFPAQAAFAQTQPTNQELKDLLEEVKTLLQEGDGTYRASIGGPIHTVGLFSLCSGEHMLYDPVVDFTVGEIIKGQDSGALATVVGFRTTGPQQFTSLIIRDIAGTFQTGETITSPAGGSAAVRGTPGLGATQKFLLVPQDSCVFSIDSVRIDRAGVLQPELKTFIKTICVDKLNVDTTDMSNCFNTVTDAIFDFSLGIEPEVGVGTKAGASALVQADVGAHGSISLVPGIGFPIVGHEPVPLRAVEFVDTGGMVLHDTGIGSILAEQFVTMSYINERAGSVTFLGAKPGKMDLIIGTAGNAKFTCQTIKPVQDTNGDMKIDSSDSKSRSCPQDFKLVLQNACFENLFGTKCGSQVAPAGFTASSDRATQISAGSVNSQQQIFGPSADLIVPFIDVQLTDAELAMVVSGLGDDALDLLSTSEDMVMEIIKPADLFQMLKDITLLKDFDTEIEKLAIEKFNDFDIENLIAEAAKATGKTDISQTFTDLGAFIDSFAIAPGGFTAVELAKRFGTISEELETLEGSTDDVRDAVNRAIGDINTFKNSDINIKIDPPSVNTNSVPSVVKNVVNGLCVDGCGWNGKLSINPGQFMQSIPAPFAFIPDIPLIPPK